MERYKAYKDSGVPWVGEIPEHIDWIRSHYSLFFEKGKLPSETNLNGEGWPYIGASDLDSSEECATFTIDGSLPETDGSDLLVLWDGARAGLSGAGKAGKLSSTVVKVTSTDEYLPRFLYWYYKGMDHYVFDQVHGTTIPHMNRRYFDDIGLLTWSISEQQAIADFLDEKTAEIDGIVSETERSIELLREYRKSVISEAVTKGLDPDAPMKDSGVEWIGEIPAGWQVKPLRYIGSCANGISKGGDYFGSGHPFVSYGNVYRDELKRPELFGLVQSTEKERDVYSLKRGDVLFTRTSENIEEVALSATVLEDIDGGTFAGFLIRMRPYEDAGLVPEFAQYYFKAEKHREFFNKEMMLVTRASLGQDLLKKLPVLLPPTDEQVAIAAFLDAKTAEIDALIADKEKQVELLKEYRKSLISEAVTGKFKVPGVK